MTQPLLLVKVIYSFNSQEKEVLTKKKKLQQVTQHEAVTALNSNRSCNQTLLSIILLTRYKMCQNESGCHPDCQPRGIIHLISPTEKTHVNTVYAPVSVPWCSAVYTKTAHRRARCLQTHIRWDTAWVKCIWHINAHTNTSKCVLDEKGNNMVPCNYLKVSNYHC